MPCESAPPRARRNSAVGNSSRGEGRGRREEEGAPGDEEGIAEGVADEEIFVETNQKKIEDRGDVGEANQHDGDLKVEEGGGSSHLVDLDEERREGAQIEVFDCN